MISIVIYLDVIQLVIISLTLGENEEGQKMYSIG